MATIAVGALLVWAGVIVVAAVVLLIRDDPRPDRRHGLGGATITELHLLELLEDTKESLPYGDDGRRSTGGP